MIKDISIKKILNDQIYNDSFISASLRDLNENCTILKSSFFLDSFNYFPISYNYETFYDLFKRQDSNSVEHFYENHFYNNFLKNENKFKIFENCFLLGSNIADNYFSNLVHFLPRIFFTNEKKINLVINRNLSNKFRNLILSLFQIKGIETKFHFIDDDFYKFKNSEFPEFFNLLKSIKVLKYFFNQILSNTKDPGYGKKIYVRREDANYRKILNESDLIEKLKKNGFKIVNPNLFEIIEQMKIFSLADLIISPHGSNLSNIIFCKSHTQIIEISPRAEKSFELNISNRYKELSNILGLKYSKIYSDSVDVKSHSKIAKKYINKNVLDESNYYKNLILKVSDIDKLIDQL